MKHIILVRSTQSAVRSPQSARKNRLTSRFLFLVVLFFSTLKPPLMMAQLTFPTKPQEVNYDVGLWKQKYEVRTETIYKNIAEMERLEGKKSDIAEQGNLQLLDTKGEILCNWKATMEQGQNQITLPNNKQLAKGIYLLNYKSENQSKTISIFNP